MARSDRQDQNELRIWDFLSEIAEKVNKVQKVSFMQPNPLAEGFPTAAGYVLSVRVTISGLHTPSGSTEIDFRRFWDNYQGKL